MTSQPFFLTLALSCALLPTTSLWEKPYMRSEGAGPEVLNSVYGGEYHGGNGGAKGVRPHKGDVSNLAELAGPILTLALNLTGSGDDSIPSSSPGDRHTASAAKKVLSGAQAAGGGESHGAGGESILEVAGRTAGSSGQYAPGIGATAGPGQPNDVEPQWLFVLGTGRSGSTTVMDMVRLLSDRIWLGGENHGMLKSLAEQFQFATAPAGEGLDKSPAWNRVATADEGVLLKDVRAYVRDFLGVPQSNAARLQYVGFKEIRQHKLKDMEWYNLVFPRARFILNWRENATAQAQSSYFSKMPLQDGVEQVKKYNQNVALFAKELPPSRIFLLPLEDFSVARFNELIGWLGYDGCRYKSVLHDNNSGANTPFGSDSLAGKSTGMIDGACTFYKDKEVDEDN